MVVGWREVWKCVREDREWEGISRIIYLTRSFQLGLLSGEGYHEKETHERNDLVKRPGTMDMKGVCHNL